jgi:hypothetical protein
MLPAPALLPLAALVLRALPVPAVAAVARAPAAAQEASFSLDVPSEVVALVTASCGGCDWGRRGREAAALELRLDGRYSQHLLLTRGSEVAEYRVALGRVGAGSHRLSLALDPKRSSRSVGGASIEAVAFRPAPLASAEEQLLAHAPVLEARPNTLGRFSDVPLVMWVEAEALPGSGTRLRYSVVFSNEDGGTPPDRLMATWGRLTDLEYVYGVELDPSGRVIAEQYQGPEHKLLPFAGRHEADHPVLYVVTDNNMLSDRGKRTIRFAPAPVAFDLSNTSREALMDAHPWTYAVSVREVRREGRVDDQARPGSDRLPDPRHFATLEACAATRDATIAFSIGVRAADGSTGWHDSDGGLPRFRIGRRATEFPNGCFRGAVALPVGTAPGHIVGLRIRAFTRIAGKDEPPLPKGAGSARLLRVNTLFLLREDDQPGPSLFSWQGAVELVPEGSAFEMSIRN